jgi:DNA-binding CsgD family transcriptional regulator/predicted DNA-binding protein (MmcQ/YjbR family)
MAHPRMYSDDDPYLTELRQVCLALPESAEVEAWGRPTFRAGKKLFAVFEGNDDHPYAVVFKPEPPERPALLDDGRFYVPAYFGPSGWVALDFTAAPVDWVEVAELMESSYRQVALKRMLAALDRETSPARGREAAERLAWADAHTALSLADRSSPLAAQDLELLATAAYLLGRVEDCLGALQRAHQLYAERGDHRGAARCAGWLAFHLSNRGDLAQASGWLGRANRLLEHERQECAEHGYLLTSAAFQQLMAGAYAEARETLAQAAGIGARVGDADLVAFARQLQGRALVWEGRVGEGLALLDEAMVAVVAGEVSPLVAGTVYCGVIEICQEISELRRAQEWTEALTAWCGKQPDMVTFTGQCLVHRAEILQLHGAWAEAVQEAKRAGERFAHAADDYATGAACYQQAELHRLSGDFTAAEDAYQQASRWGREPQPGLALLRLAQGRTDAAAAAIRRVVGETSERFRRVKLLPAQVEIMLTVGDVRAAGDAAGELTEIAGGYGTPALRAAADHARGAVLLAEGDAQAALVALRAAWRVWRELEAPYEAARVRVLVGLACRALGDEEAAAMELDAARTTFVQLGATPDLQRLEARMGREAASKAHGLTTRELQVLRLLATGTTNRAIAGELSVAEKTVDRHVSNIFTKLGVSSRAAATAYAYQHRLL